MLKYYQKFKKLILTIVLSSLLPACLATELPDLGSSGAHMPPSEERKLGRQILGQLRHAMTFYPDLAVRDYVQSVGNLLVATHTQLMPYQFFVIDSTTINAFALPGGIIGIHTGVILSAESESEMASVLAHEIAHVRLRHIAQQYDHMKTVQYSAIAGMIAAMILATQSPEAAHGALALSMAGAQQSMINFTREHEKEADQQGLAALAASGLDPHGMPSFFERMHQSSRFQGKMPEYLRTHPLTESRIQSALHQAKHFPYQQIKDNPHFHLIRARIKATTFHSPQEALVYFDTHLKKGTYQNKIAMEYGYGLSLMGLHRNQEAFDVFTKLSEKMPNELLFHLALTKIEIAVKQPQKATQRLHTLVKAHPHALSANLLLAELLIESTDSQDYKTAEKILLLQAASHPDEPAVFQLLSKAEKKLGNILEAHFSEATLRSLLGETHDAIIQLNHAKKLPHLSTRQQAQLDAKIQELKLLIDDNKSSK